eukprot:CAMPEP_0119151198 /NCGR_PEP_ID=MMETSP1310-20130426/45990_1 /TAXON_ID=464262 /ORGANISM="Genus nov. species nov., Strain RCC2339" /LENGTH=167 /DNA_ID=CAMNT_0007143455 /DNA_START=115 /DNA_END=614 /DNA_ORIENTATION=+
MAASTENGGVDPRAGVCTVPNNYGVVDEAMCCRRVVVPRGATVWEVKKAVLEVYENQYRCEDVTLYMRSFGETNLVPVTTNRRVSMLLSYEPHPELGVCGDHQEDLVVLTVGPVLDDSESRLLAVPVMHPTPARVMEAALGEVRLESHQDHGSLLALCGRLAELYEP